MEEDVIRNKLHRIQNHLHRILVWQASHSGEGPLSTHSRLVERLERTEHALTRFTAIWATVLSVLALVWAALLVWWKA